MGLPVPTKAIIAAWRFPGSVLSWCFFVPLGVLFIMKTLKDEWYIVIKSAFLRVQFPTRREYRRVGRLCMRDNTTFIMPGRTSPVSASGRSSVMRWTVLLVKRFQVIFFKYLYIRTHKLHHALNETDGYIHWQLKAKINSLGSNHITSKMLLVPYYIGGLTSQFHLIGPLITTKQKRTYRRGNFLCPAKGNGATSNNWTPQKLCFPSLQHLC